MELIIKVECLIDRGEVGGEVWYPWKWCVGFVEASLWSVEVVEVECGIGISYMAA